MGTGRLLPHEGTRTRNTLTIPLSSLSLFDVPATARSQQPQQPQRWSRARHCGGAHFLFYALISPDCQSDLIYFEFMPIHFTVPVRVQVRATPKPPETPRSAPCPLRPLLISMLPLFSIIRATAALSSVSLLYSHPHFRAPITVALLRGHRRDWVRCAACIGIAALRISLPRFSEKQTLQILEVRRSPEAPLFRINCSHGDLAIAQTEVQS